MRDSTSLLLSMAVTIWLIVRSRGSQVNSQGSQDSGKQIYFHSVDTSFNPRYIRQLALVVRPRNESFDLVLNLAQNYPHDPWITFTLGLKNRKTSRYRTLFQYDTNICQLMDNKGTQFMRTVLQGFWQQASMPFSCPIRKGNYSWSGLKANNFNLPQFFAASYQVVVVTYFRVNSERITVANVSILAELK